jgi:hypothetical protein
MARPNLSASQSYSTYGGTASRQNRHRGNNEMRSSPFVGRDFFEHGDRKSDIFEDDAERTYRPYSGLGRSSIANITLVRDNATVVSTPGGQIYQALAPAAVFDSRHTVLVLWMIDRDCWGRGESFSSITGKLNSFVPNASVSWQERRGDFPVSPGRTVRLAG